MKKINKARLLIAVFLILSVTACSKTPAARFYTLSPMTADNADTQNTQSNKHILSVGPIKVASYLDRSEIVTRSNSTNIELAGFDRWAEPFEDIVASTLSENISSILPRFQRLPTSGPRQRLIISCW